MTRSAVTSGGGTELSQADKDLYEQKLVSAIDFTTIPLALMDASVASSQVGDFVKIDGGYATVLKTNPTVEADLALLGGGTPAGGSADSVVVSVELPSGSYGGNSLVINQWVKRVFNTIRATTAGIGTLNAGTVNLQAGKYSVSGFMMYYAPKPLQLRIQNTTASATEVVGASFYNATNAMFSVPISGEFELSVASDLELQFYPKVSNSNGATLGWSAGTGEPEVFSVLKFTKLS